VRGSAMFDDNRRHLYIAGPYTRPDPVINTNAACRVGTIVFEETPWIPHVPHITLLWHAITPRPIEFWYELDMAHMSRCDALVRLPGDSSGADKEYMFALNLGLQIVEFGDLPKEAQKVWSSR